MKETLSEACKSGKGTRGALALIQSFCLMSSILFAACPAFANLRNTSIKPASDPQMTKEERAKAVKLLLDSQKEFLDAVENLTDAQWNYRATPFKWSAGLTAEHIMLTQDGIFSVIERALAQEPNPNWETKTAGKEALLE